MEVFISRKLDNDGFKDEYFKDIKYVDCWENKNRLAVRILDNYKEARTIYNVIKFEVY